jgi:hypothetical protein
MAIREALGFGPDIAVNGSVYMNVVHPTAMATRASVEKYFMIGTLQREFVCQYVRGAIWGYVTGNACPRSIRCMKRASHK